MLLPGNHVDGGPPLMPGGPALMPGGTDTAVQVGDDGALRPGNGIDRGPAWMPGRADTAVRVGPDEVLRPGNRVTYDPPLLPGGTDSAVRVGEDGALRGGSPAPRPGSSAQDVDELDWLNHPIPVRSGPTFTLKQWFDALRAQGIGTHPEGDDEDAARHYRPLFRPDATGPAGSAAVGPDGAPRGAAGQNPGSKDGLEITGYALKGGSTVDQTMGIAEGTFSLADNPDVWSRRGPGDPLLCPSEASQFGIYSDMVADLAAMGAGRIRRAKRCDLYWGSLFPRQGYATEGSYQDGVMFPPPAEVGAKLRGDDWAALLPFQRMVLACWRHGIKLTVTPFHSCGGSPLMVNFNETGDEDNIRSGEEEAYCHDGTPATRATVAAARPPHQRGFMVATTAGWDPWYWMDLSGAGTSDERHYQQFAVNVWPSQAGDAVDGYLSDYMMRCARRKALGLAALADALAEYLERLQFVFLMLGHSLFDVVEEVEFANELDGHFSPKESEHWVQEGLTADSVVVGEELVAEYAARELGRYCALMSGPFRDRLPGMRFHVGECYSQPYKDLAIRAAFMHDVIAEGMRVEVALWVERQSRRLDADRLGVDIREEYAEWSECCEAAGYWWPKRAAADAELIAFSEKDLAHRAGFHWFHAADTDHDTDGVIVTPVTGYQDELALLETVDLFRATVIDPLEAAGFQMGICVNAMGFPALYPPKPDVGSNPWFARTTPIYQAAMLIRWFATLRAAGVDYACWFTGMRAPSDFSGSAYDWDEFDAMGLRNDCVIDGKYGRDEIAFPRPAWYAWQNWANFMSHCTRADVVHAGKGCMVIRFTLDDGIAPYPYAQFMWLDQYATNQVVHPDRDDRTLPYAWVTLVGVPAADVSSDVVLLRLIPRVVETEYPLTVLASDTDANGYALPGSEADWDWSGWENAVGFTMDGDSQVGILLQADPTVVAAPICVLTYAPVVSVA